MENDKRELKPVKQSDIIYYSLSILGLQLITVFYITYNKLLLFFASCIFIINLILLFSKTVKEKLDYQIIKT